MSTLVIVGYNDPYKAEEVRSKLRKLQSEYLLDLQDAAVAVKNEKGKVKLHRSDTLTAAGAISYGVLGTLSGLIFLNAMASAAFGALTGAGVNKHFMKELSATLSPGSSILFVLLRRLTPYRNGVLEELNGTGGKILQSSLSYEDEGKLQAALSAAR
jgi:uncharacterized membrane protein